jgi:hypothetical protein
MDANGATYRSARHAVVTCHMSNDTAHRGALEAAMPACDDRQHSQRQRSNPE